MYEQGLDCQHQTKNLTIELSQMNDGTKGAEMLAFLDKTSIYIGKGEIGGYLGQIFWKNVEEMLSYCGKSNFVPY